MFSWAIGWISKRLKNELAMVNEPPVFELLRFDCSCLCWHCSCLCWPFQVDSSIAVLFHLFVGYCKSSVCLVFFSVPRPFFFWFLGEAVLRDCGFTKVTSLIFSVRMWKKINKCTVCIMGIFPFYARTQKTKFPMTVPNYYKHIFCLLRKKDFWNIKLFYQMSHKIRKCTFIHVLPAKIQTSQRACVVWLESCLGAFYQARMHNFTMRTTKTECESWFESLFGSDVRFHIKMFSDPNLGERKRASGLGYWTLRLSSFYLQKTNKNDSKAIKV